MRTPDWRTLPLEAGDLAHPIDQIGELPELSPVMHCGGCPSITFPTKMIYRIPVTTSNQDTRRRSQPPADLTHHDVRGHHLAFE